jgi:2-polyprenyl-6-methoxyphenol hydroxylase-like FAD-dependent oxidoreductase
VHDVAIVGAGPVGATLALALADASLDVVIFDSRSAGETTRGDRTLALSHGARLIFERLGVWTPLAATRGAVTPIVTIDVSQALHPIAGQGFNLGLRDAYDLARTIIDSPRDAIGSAPMLERYRQSRSRDRRAGIAITHGLVQLFGNDWPWLRVPRGIGMMLLDTVPLAKRAFGRAMLFGMR